MPGSIKIDDGSGNYTILTNAGSLGSDKTITIPNETATLATTNGITEVDQWTLTTAVTSNTTVSSNLSRISTANLAGEALGTGMSVSSGIWTFPSTGYWLVNVQAAWRTASNDGCALKIEGTDDNSTYSHIGQINFGKDNDGSNIDAVTFGQVWLKITDTSNDKIRFVTSSIGSGSELRGAPTYNYTSFVFIKVGEV